MKRFLLKLGLFFLPFAAVFSVPVAVLVLSDEILSGDEIAKKHFEGSHDAVYGAAYTNPDARYKLVGLALRQPEVMALGSSRALEIQGNFFIGNNDVFYNAGLLVERLYEFRRALAHLPKEATTKKLILVLDQSSFNPNWPNAVDNPQFEAEVGTGRSDVLNLIQHGFRSWRDIVGDRLDLLTLATAHPHIGVNGRMRGNGFAWDGSRVYADILRDPEGASDFQFKDSLERIAQGSKHFEFGAEVDQPAVAEIQQLLAECQRRGFSVTAYLAPFAPTVDRAMRASTKHAYVSKIAPALAPIFAAAGVTLFDFTSCEAHGCRDEEFFDGFHAGPKADARLIAVVADNVPWLDAMIDQDDLRARVARSPRGPLLAPRDDS